MRRSKDYLDRQPSGVSLVIPVIGLPVIAARSSSGSRWVSGSCSSPSPDSGSVSVIGTLVCNAGSKDSPGQQVLDTPAVTLSPQGSAQFSGVFGSIPVCSKPVFLIRAGTRWIANAAVLTTGSANDEN